MDSVRGGVRDGERSRSVKPVPHGERVQIPPTAPSCAVKAVRERADKVYKLSGYPPVVVIVGYELYDEIMNVVGEAANYAMQKEVEIERGKVSDSLATQFFGFPIRFADWHDGIAALPRQLLERPYVCFGIEW